MGLYTAGSFVRITRPELEEWLDSLQLHHQWTLMPNRAGVYLLPVGENVAVKLSSTIGSSDDAMGVGMGSMQLALVSTVTKQVLNKKAQGQSHFARTTNWRKNWLKGVDLMREAYQKSQGFYDALAIIEDRDKYKADLLAKIQAIPNWQGNSLLADFHGRVQSNGILTTNQVESINRLAKATTEDAVLLPRMRELYRVAVKAKNQWLIQFTTDMGRLVGSGRSMSPRQREAMEQNFQRYGV